MFDEEKTALEIKASRATGEAIQKATGVSRGSPAPQNAWTGNTIHSFTLNNFNGPTTGPEQTESKDVSHEEPKPINGRAPQQPSPAPAPAFDRRRVAKEIASKVKASKDNEVRFEGILLYVFQVETPLALNDEELVKLHALVSDW
ncbi:hypothetical protein [Chitinimonas sp.]|uniref:hypothetical protein n=1 Tax=Chitinimonas sp. TaxID=1934313 RepID=UPI0035AEA355